MMELMRRLKRVFLAHNKECYGKSRKCISAKKLIWCGGSYTVEASLIICFIVCIIWGMVSIGFYVHDRYITEIAITDCIKKENRRVIECSEQFDGKIDWNEWSQKSILWRIFYEGKVDELKNQVEEKIRGKLLISNLQQIQAEIKVGKVQLKYQMEIYFPGRWIQNILSKKRLTIVNQIEVEEKESEELIRLCKAIK